MSLKANRRFSSNEIASRFKSVGGELCKAVAVKAVGSLEDVPHELR